MTRLLTLAAAGLVLAGCGLTPQSEFVRGQIAEQGAAAYDQGLADAEWFICNAASVGAVKRRYAVSEAKAESYRKLCEQGEAPILTPPAE